MSISAQELILMRRAHLQKQDTDRKKKPEEEKRDTRVQVASLVTQPRQLASSTALPVHNYMPFPPKTVACAKAYVGRPKVRKDEEDALPVEPAVAPKVMAARELVRGELSCEELVRRKRARYDACASLESLLADCGTELCAGGNLDNDGVTSYHTLLPLEAFDDAMFDELTLADWARRIHENNGLPCRVYHSNGDFYAWVQARAVDCNVATQHINVELDNGTADAVPRVCVCFAAENPINFSERFAAAFYRRKRAIDLLRAELFIDSVPQDEYQMIDCTVLERVKVMAVSTPRLMKVEGNLDVQSLLLEVRTDYSRSMNADLLKSFARTGGVSRLSFLANLEEKRRDARVVPMHGISSTANRDGMKAIVASFQRHSLFAHNTVLSSLTRQVRAYSDALLSRSIFLLDMGLEQQRPLSLMNFDDVETIAVQASVRFLRESWLDAIVSSVRDSLPFLVKSEGLYPHFTNAEEYKGSKAEHFLRMLQCEMQDTLYHHLKCSIEAFTRFLEDAGNFMTIIHSVNELQLKEGHHPAISEVFGWDARVSKEFLKKPPYRSAPLFRVSVQIKARAPSTVRQTPIEESIVLKNEFVSMHDGARLGGGETIAPMQPTSAEKEFEPILQYSTTTAAIRSSISLLLTRCLSLHGDLHTVERHIFDFLGDPVFATLQTLNMNGPFMQSCMSRIDQVLVRTSEAMEKYLNTFMPFEDIILFDLQQYMNKFDENFPTTKGIDNEINRFLQRQEELQQSIPTEVDLGLVSVDCLELRRQLIAKCMQAVSRILNMLSLRAVAKEDEIEKQFTELHSNLMKPTETPEEVVATKDFIATIPEKLFDLKLIINETCDIHNVLELFRQRLSEEEFHKKWYVLGWPARLDEEITLRAHELEETKRRMCASMRRAQELFGKEVAHMQQVIRQYFQNCNLARLSDISKDANAVLEKIQSLQQQANTFNTHEKLFNIERTDYSAVQQLGPDFEPYASLWLTVESWTTSSQMWHCTPFIEIDAVALEQRVIEDYKTICKCTRDERLTPDLIKIAELTMQKIEEFRPLVPTIRYLRTCGMRERHWAQLSKEIGKEIRPGVNLKHLKDVVALDLPSQEEIIMRIAEIADREYHIEMSLQRMKEQWNGMHMMLCLHKDTGCYIISKSVVDETQELLDDQTLLTQALSFSPFKKIFEDDIRNWEATLHVVQNVLDEWIKCQKLWLYFEPIFQSEDIARQIPQEFKRFRQVHLHWTTLTNQAHQLDLTMKFCQTSEKCHEVLQECNQLLEQVERGLNQYLESKRASFARFYFLSDDELLTILSEARDPQKLQPHFRKLFENIASLNMRGADNEILGMYSHMKEYIPFSQPVFPRKYVENWLTEVEQVMKLSVRAQLERAIKDFATTSRVDFIMRSPGQISIAVYQIMWTQACEMTLMTHGSLQPYAPTALEDLMVLVGAVRQPLTNLQRMNLSGLITIEVHARDIVDKLTQDKVSSVYDFGWVSQLRSYWEGNDCYLRQVETQFRYGGEYLGNTTRLVITPLTDRIYLTLTGAMHMFLGGAPAGPAGTGKTETVKDLAKAVAKQCVVFNCQEGMTYRSMGKFFKGLAQAGAWACFDEFNRIDVEVLSVVAQQVSSLQEAARSRQYRIPFEGTEIVVDPSYAVFITMNPGYAGRTELPDNLKVLFRPVACMVPDYAMIAEIRLFSFGYAESRKLARKMVATFKLSSEQLSSQDHYDFGMRAVNTVISAAGLMKREHPDECEDILLFRALRDSNAPKFLEEDLLLFNGITSDLFPGVQLPIAEYGDFLSTLFEKAAEQHLQPTDMFIRKCIEIYEMSILRHGQMTVGPTMGGKTCATQVLQAAMIALHKKLGSTRFSEVKTYALNPKAVTMSQLYGGFDEATGEWHDGLVGELFRAAARDTSDTRHWIIFDGPVDALWIESMNTVLDDNKKLCLISGEIIAMTPYMNCWFEVEDLAVASPATVSRAGMIYMEPDTCVGVTNLVRSWQQHRLPSTMEPYKEHLQKLCEEIFPALIQFVQTQVTEYSSSVWPNLTVSCFNIFATLLTPFTPTRTYDVPPEKLTLLQEAYLHFLVFSIVWSFGATGDKLSRERFDKFLRDVLRQYKLDLELPPTGCLQDYEFIVEECRWVAWVDRLPPFTTQVTQANITDIIVPTADVARFKHIHKLLLTHSYHTLCCGPTGTGKTVLLKQLLIDEMPKEFVPIFFTFSARTSANQTQDLIFSKLEVRRRGSPQIWGAPVNKKFVVFIDDMNMPLKEQYGAQPPIEILRQFMDYHGWYDRRTRDFFHVVDILYAGAMGPPGGGRNHISNRFLRHFNQIAFPDVDDDSMRRIFTSLLNSYFTPFPESIRLKITSIVEASIDIYNTVLKELRPTTSRPHYLFNLRDLSKVTSGVANATARSVADVPALIRLWLHEEMRTFKDRLIDEHDRNWFDQLLEKQVQTQFNMPLVDVLMIRAPATSTAAALSELLFVDFMEGKDFKNRAYHQVNDFDLLVKHLEKQQAEYNQHAMSQKLTLVLFIDAVQHVCRIARVIRKSKGHVLLLGVGGFGRQSLSRLAAHVCEYDLSQVEISKGYSMRSWRDDIKEVLRSVAFRGKQVLFLVTDTQIIHESMLEDVNNLLNSGEVPNLFEGQEFEDLLSAMKPLCIAENLPLDKISVYARFVRACCNNLHISFCMSPLGETFRNRLRMFPALVSCCTIDWFSAWPQQALQSVARNFLASASLLQDGQSTTNVIKCAEVCVAIYQSVERMSVRFLTETRRYNYVTPSSFLELLQTFRTLLESRTLDNETNQGRFVNGLRKLRETEGSVAGLQQTLAENQPILIEKSESIKVLVQEMEVHTASAETTKKEAQREREAVATMQAECAMIEEQAHGQLAEALPELDRALENLKNLKSSQITEVAGYKTPTSGVVMTVQGICILFQIKPIMRASNSLEEKKPDYWATAKEQLLNNPNALMQRLINYDKEHIPERLIQAVRPLVSSEDFTPKKIAGASQACAAMCQWTHAMVRFHEVNKKVEPLRKRLAIAQGANRQAQEKLHLAEKRLEEVAQSLAEMQTRKESAEQEMRQLEERVRHTELKLERAAMLIDGLQGEKKNWMKSLEELKGNAQFLMGDMLAAAGQVVYCGPFTAVYRQELIESWRSELVKHHIRHSPQLSVYHTLQDAVQTREWGLNGLPMDTLSIENALFLSNTRRWPLMIDPQTQANKWIRKTYKDTLEVLKPSQRDIIKRMEYCIRAGRSVLLENVGEDIDANLNPLLNKQTFMQGDVEMIRISDTAIPWNRKFRFFMTTKWPNPHYIPEVMVRVTVLNFFITPQGLEDQLLGVVVGQERKDLETRRSDLIQKNAAMKADLVDIQRTILCKMEAVRGDILDDVELIQYLNESKEKTVEIVSEVAEAEEAEIEINASRERYRPIARHSSCLYFCCATLSNVDPMYQYSLQWFVQLYIVGIEHAAKAEDIQGRLQNLQDYFTYSFYQNVSRSLFEKHKLMFSFFLCLHILRQNGGIVESELHFLLQGASMIESTPEPNPNPAWLTASTWSELCYLSRHFLVFSGMPRYIADNLEHFRLIFMSSNAHRESLGAIWDQKLTRMQHMMFLRCLRPDKLMEAMQDFVSCNMGDRFLRPPPFDLLVSFKDSTAATPLIFVLSQGADPYDDWKRFAESQGMSKKLYDISLGQGQGPRAERMLQEGTESGAWVLLQNCHLATSWMPTLERLVEAMSQNAIHPNFRLWLTSIPNPHFPVSVLQTGVKMTNEPPKGLQANVTRSLLSYTNNYLECCKKTVEFKKLFFSLIFFHALIQERRKFGPLGWNIPYEYTSGDLGCCVDQIKMFLNKYAEVPFTVIRELSGNIHYGGRVTDDWDRRTLNTLLERFVVSDVMQDDYQFTSLPNYFSIPATSQQRYLRHVASWPINTPSEVFGLHENADIMCARSETLETLAAIAQLEGENVTSPTSGRTSDEQVIDLAEAIQAKLRAPFDIDKFRHQYPTKYENSMNTVLVQEAIRFNHLLVLVHHTLETLPLAIKGEVVMSKELEDVYRSIYNNTIPAQWARRAYPSLKFLAAWVDDLVLRLDMIQTWFIQGHPKTFWISGFFFPQAFLTGILQNFARQQQVSIDTISYDFEWLRILPEEVQSAPPIGCYIHGVFMEGARIDTDTLSMAESKPKMLFDPVPLLWLKPVVNRVKPPEQEVYVCPLYKTTLRAGTLSTTGHSTNFVLSIEVPTTQDPKHWIRRGAAMVCALNI